MNTQEWTMWLTLLAAVDAPYLLPVVDEDDEELHATKTLPPIPEAQRPMLWI